MENEIKNEPKQNNISIPAAIIITGVLIAGAIFITNSKNKTTTATNGERQQTTQQAQNGTADITKVKITGEPFIGDQNAPVVVAYWFDYQCPFCKRTETAVMPQLINDYVKTGKVKIVYKDFQFLGPDSQTAGLAARAVFEVAPQTFYEWHKAMYDKQDNENSGWGNKEDVIALTKSILGDTKTKRASGLMDSKRAEYQKIMDADKTEGESFGVSGTPGFVIGKQLIVGAQPYNIINQAIDLALQGK